MERLFGHLVHNLMDYMAYENEKRYLVDSFGCKNPTIELCKQLRSYRNDVAPNPRIEDFIRFHYRPCDARCEYYIPLESALPILKHTVVEMGSIVICQKLYTISVLYSLEGRFPTELELLLHQAGSQLNQTFEMFHNIQFQMDEKEDVPIKNKNIPEPYLLTKNLEQNCCMCHDSLIKDQSVITLPCFHTFHTSFHNSKGECVGIEKWLATSNLCPLCKQDIS